MRVRRIPGYEALRICFDACPVFADVELAAHKDAWTRAKILHRDISAENILIDVLDGRGFLNDWDLAKLRDDLGSTVCACGSQNSEPIRGANLWR